MENICRNCQNEITENFCANCGQKKYKRIDKKYILDELQYTVFHTNKGLLYSLKKILRNPGKTAREFIDGNRVNHYKPILLVFVLSGLAAFVSFKILKLNEMMNAQFSQQKMNSKFAGDLMSFLSSYSSLIMLLFIPYFAAVTRIAFRKWGHNYYEHVVINAYVLAFNTMVSILFLYPVMFYFKDTPDTFYSLTQLSMLIIPLVLVWFFKEFYKEKTLKSVIAKVLGIIVLAIVGYLIFMIVAGLIAFAIAMLKGPEALEYLKQK